MHREGTTTTTFIDPPSNAQRYTPKAAPMEIPEGSRIMTGAKRIVLGIPNALVPKRTGKQPTVVQAHN